MEKSFTCSSKDGDFQRSILIHSPMGNDKYAPFFSWSYEICKESLIHSDMWIPETFSFRKKMKHSSPKIGSLY